MEHLRKHADEGNNGARCALVNLLTSENIISTTTIEEAEKIIDAIPLSGYQDYTGRCGYFRKRINDYREKELNRAEQERLAKLAEERAAEERAEQERLAKLAEERAEQERLAKLAAEKASAEEAERRRLVAETAKRDMEKREKEKWESINFKVAAAWVIGTVLVLFFLAFNALEHNDSAEVTMEWIKTNPIGLLGIYSFSVAVISLFLHRCARNHKNHVPIISAVISLVLMVTPVAFTVLMTIYSHIVYILSWGLVIGFGIAILAGIAWMLGLR